MCGRRLCALLLLFCLCVGGLRGSVPDNRQCDRLRDTLRDRGAPLQTDVRPPRSGLAGSACGTHTGCCPTAVQLQLSQLAQRDLRLLLLNSTAAVHQLLLQQAHHVQGAILRVIIDARESTLETFNGAYPASAGLASRPVTQLYSAFSQYFQSMLSDVQLEQKVVTFFDDLFPLVYKDALQPSARQLPEQLVNCLRRQREQLQPFGDAPLLVQERLVRLLGTAKFYLQALHVGAQVLNTTGQLRFSDSCYAGLVRHDYCALCEPRPTREEPPPPCMTLCFNVLRGCVAPLSSLATTWRGYVDALARLSTSLQQSNDVKSYFFRMNVKMSEAMVSVWGNKEDIQKRVELLCGGGSLSGGRSRRRRRRQQPPLPYSRSGDLQLTLPQRQLTELENTDPVPLISYLSVFNGQIDLHRDLFEKLPDATCTAGVAHGRRPCWNGTAVGEYNGRLPEVGLESQAFNPEVAVGGTLDPAVEELAGKLGRIRQISLDKLMTSPSSDSLHSDWTEGSGSGGWQYEYDDDEDSTYDYYDYGDYGSGSGYGDDEDFYGDILEGSTEHSLSGDSDDMDVDLAPGIVDTGGNTTARSGDSALNSTTPRPSTAPSQHSSTTCAVLLLAAVVALVGGI